MRIADDGEILLNGPERVHRLLAQRGGHRRGARPDGWLHTGDIGELDDDGFLRITGRKKELIVTAGGKNVAPAVLEDRLRAHPLVSQCMVVGDGRPFIACLVTLDEEALEPLEGAARRAWPTRRVADLADDAGADRRDPGGGGRRQQGGVPGRVDPQVPVLPGRLHRGRTAT